MPPVLNTQLCGNNPNFLILTTINFVVSDFAYRYFHTQAIKGDLHVQETFLFIIRKIVLYIL